MTAVPGVQEVAEAIAAAWARPGAVTDGFRFEDARAADGAVEVGFRWRRDPQRYLVRLPHPGLVEAAVGERFDVRQAVGELDLWLMEELDTGLVARAERRRVGDAVLLVDRPHRRSGWFVGCVPLRFSPVDSRRAREEAARTGRRFVVIASSGAPTEPIADPGRHLDGAGLDGAAGRCAVADGSLLAWLTVDRGELGSPVVGQAVVVRLDDTTARIAHLELRTDDTIAADDLVAAACRAAIEAGAALLVADRGLRALRRFGFRDDGDHLVARHDEMVEPV